MTAPAIPFVWEGDGFKPAGAHWGRLCDKHFVVGAVYPLEVRQDRSSASHREYFAKMNDTFHTLPESMAGRWDTPEHLRRWCLIKAGFHDERSIVCGSKAEATKVAAFVRPMDTYAVVLVRGSVVQVFTAKSQSYKAMPKGEFQRSKDAVYAVLDELLGVDRGTVARAEQAA